MAKYAAAALLLLCSLLHLSHAAAQDPKRKATTDVPLTKEALEANFIAVRVDQLHVDGPLEELKGSGGVRIDRRTIPVRFFQTRRPLRLEDQGHTGDVVPPEWSVGYTVGTERSLSS